LQIESSSDVVHQEKITLHFSKLTIPTFISSPNSTHTEKDAKTMRLRMRRKITELYPLNKS
jgi:hypothetical protein